MSSAKWRPFCLGLNVLKQGLFTKSMRPCCDLVSFLLSYLWLVAAAADYIYREITNLPAIHEPHIYDLYKRPTVSTIWYQNTDTGWYVFKIWMGTGMDSEY